MKIPNSANFMQNTTFNYNYLKTISGVRFTPREIDIVACILSGRGAKTIAQFLSIEEKTVETHKYNVMRKLERNSKEGIIEFIEKSDKYTALKRHYVGLLSNVIFEKQLQKILYLSKNKGLTCVLIYEKSKDNISFVSGLEKYLKCAGIKVYGETQGKHNLLSQQIAPQKVDSIIYLASESFLEKLKIGDNQTKLEIEEFKQKILSNRGKVIFLFQNEEPLLHSPQAIQDAEYIDFGGPQEESYSNIFNILQAILPNSGVEEIALEFKKYFKDIYNSYENPLLTQKVDIDTDTNDIELKNRAGKAQDHSLIIQPKASIRSDLIVPTESTLLNRHELLSQIEKALNGDEDIQTVALVGIGGSGKTTIARQYALNQEGPVVWEINAETRENLMSSFENLAYALSQTEDEKKILRGLLEITNPKDKEDKVVLFVKDKLKSKANWFLIYDNVEKFADIQKYFPFSAENWGKGKIIITSRDSNIQYNNHIKTAISLSELDINDRVILFNNIIANDHASQFDNMQSEQLVFFLNHIPPFPLDVSIAAYYLKTTNLPYKNYIAHLNKYNKDLDTMQQDIIKEATQYAKTRYSIITLSLDCFLRVNKEFEELLLLVSLIDSQNIPKDILTSYKNEIIVDSFIYHLRKYSLTICSPSDEFHSTPYLTIHRSTQEISLDYLVKFLNLNENTTHLKLMGQVLEKFVSKIFDTVDFDRIKNLKSHCEAFLSHGNLFGKDLNATLEGILGGIYFELGDYFNAKSLLEASLKFLDRNTKDGEAHYAKVLVYLGMVYRKLGDYPTAKDVTERSLEIYKRDFPDNHLETAWALGNLGVINRHLGNYVDSKVHTKESLEIYDKYIGKNYIGKGWVLANLGSIYRNLGQFKKAQDLLEQSLLIYQENLPDDHLEIARVLEQLADTHRNLGNYSEAEILLNKCLKIFVDHYGNEHIEIAWILIHLGKLYRDAGYLENSMDFQGQEKGILQLGNKKKLKETSQEQSEKHILSHNYYHKAKELLVGGLETFEKQFGKDHTSTARILIYLSGFHVNSGNFDAAEALLKQGLDIYIENFGEEHLKTACAFRSLGEIYFLKGELEAAETFVSKGLRIFQKYNHPECFKAMENMAEIKLKESLNLNDKHKIKSYEAQAIDYLKQALRIVQAQFPADSLQMIRIQTKLQKLQGLN